MHLCSGWGVQVENKVYDAVFLFLTGVSKWGTVDLDMRLVYITLAMKQTAARNVDRYVRN